MSSLVHKISWFVLFWRNILRMEAKKSSNFVYTTGLLQHFIINDLNTAGFEQQLNIVLTMQAPVEEVPRPRVVMEDFLVVSVREIHDWNRIQLMLTHA